MGYIQSKNFCSDVEYMKTVILRVTRKMQLSTISKNGENIELKYKSRRFDFSIFIIKIDEKEVEVTMQSFDSVKKNYVEQVMSVIDKEFFAAPFKDIDNYTRIISYQELCDIVLSKSNDKFNYIFKDESQDIISNLRTSFQNMVKEHLRVVKQEENFEYKNAIILTNAIIVNLTQIILKQVFTENDKLSRYLEKIVFNNSNFLSNLDNIDFIKIYSSLKDNYEKYLLELYGKNLRLYEAVTSTWDVRITIFFCLLLFTPLFPISIIYFIKKICDSKFPIGCKFNKQTLVKLLYFSEIINKSTLQEYL